MNNEPVILWSAIEKVDPEFWKGTWFRRVNAPTSAELTKLSQTIARRVGRFLERQGLLERDAENSYLAGDVLAAGLMDQLKTNVRYWLI